MEILSPAGSLSALEAAVHNGADAVYLGLSEFNARIGAENFTKNNISSAIDFCHERGVRVHAVLNTLVSDREMPAAIDTAKTLVTAGVDAIIVQDLGLADELMKRTDVDLHASTQLCAHSYDGVSFLADMGFRRVVLARELSRKEIEYITARSPIETEIFCHGAMCMAYSGQCYMSAIVGGRSGNRGRCAQPCRLPYGNGYELSLKDMCLLKYVSTLKDIGVASLKIEGRMKSAEYVGAVTRAYAQANKGKPFEQKDEDFLAGIFSRDGFSDGYFTERTGSGMFGTRSITTNSFSLKNAEFKRLNINFSLSEKNDTELTLAARTSDGYGAESVVKWENATNLPTTKEAVLKSLSKLGDTVYNLDETKIEFPDNAFIPVSSLNSARRDVILKITEMRKIINHGFLDIPLTYPKKNTDYQKPLNEAYFTDIISDISENNADYLWLPVMQAGGKSLENIIKKFPERVGLWLPQVFSDAEKYAVVGKLKKAKEQGITKILVNNIGQIYMCQSLGFKIATDYGMNVFNSFTADFLKRKGAEEQTLSFELNFSQINDLISSDSALIVYGRLPLMCIKNCIKEKHVQCRKNAHSKAYILKDRTSRSFYVSCEYGCRNRIWNGDVLWLADKKIPNCRYRRFIFTDESEKTSNFGPDKIILDYEKNQPFSGEKGFTRGLYFRKV